MDFIWKLVEVVWADIVLSGDNAIVIALACRGLPDVQRKIAVGCGVAGAVLARIALLFAASFMLGVPFVHMLGGAFLIYIAAKLWRDDGAWQSSKDNSGSLFAAIATVVTADIIMSFDNVVSVAAIADQSRALLIFGTLLSLPIMVFCASAISSIISRFPIIGKASAVFLGFIGGLTIMSESFIDFGSELEFVAAIGCAVGVAMHGVLSDVQAQAKFAR